MIVLEGAKRTGGRMFRLGAGLCFLGLVAACGSSGSVALKNPNYFSGRVDRDSGVMTGLYNPAGFSQAQVRRATAAVCQSGRLASFSAAAQEDLMAYSLTCRGGISSAYDFVSFERTAANLALLEATGTDGAGTILFTKKNVRLGGQGPVVPSVASVPPSAPPAQAQIDKAPSEEDDVRNRCKDSITIYCKDRSSGRIIPNVKPRR